MYKIREGQCPGDVLKLGTKDTSNDKLREK